MKIRTTAAISAAALTLLLIGAQAAQAAPGQQGSGALRPLVSAGTITKEQARTVHEAIKSECQSSKAEALSTLVSEGVISQAQADAVAAAPRSVRRLVDAGTLTRAQADAIRAELDEYSGGTGSNRSAALAALVSDGTLTAAQADAIAAALPARPAAGPGN